MFLGAKNYLFYSDKIRKVSEPQPSLNQSSQTGGDPKDEDEEQTYFYTEEDYMNDFYTLLKNVSCHENTKNEVKIYCFVSISLKYVCFLLR